MEVKEEKEEEEEEQQQRTWYQRQLRSSRMKSGSNNDAVKSKAVYCHEKEHTLLLKREVLQNLVECLGICKRLVKQRHGSSGIMFFVGCVGLRAKDILGRRVAKQMVPASVQLLQSIDPVLHELSKGLARSTSQPSPPQGLCSGLFEVASFPEELQCCDGLWYTSHEQAPLSPTAISVDDQNTGVWISGVVERPGS